MTPSDAWRIDFRLFLEVRQRWIDRDRPSDAHIADMHDWLLDAMLDPANAGTPDPAIDGIWIGRPGRGVLVLYGLNADTKIISVFEIGSPSSAAP